MNTSPGISYELAQARINDLRHQARRASLARAAQAEPQARRPRVSGRLHLRAVGRHRVATLGS
jgi:hypothetical protein